MNILLCFVFLFEMIRIKGVALNVSLKAFAVNEFL